MAKSKKADKSTEVPEMTAEQRVEIGTPIVWGPRGAGKTLFALNSTFQPVHIIDVENSSYDYDVHQKVLIEKGFFPQEFTRAFTPTWADFKAEWSRINNSSDRYGTIVVDTIGQVSEWVKTQKFLAKGNNAQKMAQVVWGEVRDSLRNLILTLNAKADLVILLAHEREYQGQFSPRCNPAAIELCSHSIRLQRKPNQQRPDGLITYTRLPFLPPRIPDITLTKLLEYIERPADWNDLSDEEMAPEPQENAYIPDGDDE